MLKNKQIINNKLLLTTLACAIISPLGSSYAQNLWAHLVTQPVVSSIQQTPHKSYPSTALNSDPNGEQITVIRYSDANGQLTTTTTSQGFGSDDTTWKQSATYTQKVMSDTYTGHTLVQYHGKGNQAMLTTAYDAMGRTVATTDTEYGLTHDDVHTTHKQITYTQKDGVTTVALIQLDNKNSDKTAYTQLTDYNTLGQKISQWDNMPEHNGSYFKESEQSPAVTYTYNDLGKADTTTLLPNAQGFQPFNAKDSKTYDAQGRVITDVKTQAGNMQFTSTEEYDQQITTQTNTYDDVNNSLASQSTGVFADNGKVLTDTSVPTPIKTQYFNDQQKVIRETIAGNDVAINSASAGLTNQMTYDNFGENTQQASTANGAKLTKGLSDTPQTLQSTSTFDALGTLATSTIGSGDDKITVNFDHSDLTNSLTSKTVNGTRRYDYQHGIQGETLTEYRGNLTPDSNGKLSQAIKQTTTYREGGYTVTQSGWNGPNVSSTAFTKTIYGDVHDKRMPLEQTIDDGAGNVTTTDYRYDYATGLQTKVTKTNNADTHSSTTTTTYRADGKVLSISFADDTNTTPKTVTYQYSDASQPSISLDNLTVKTDLTGVTTHYAYFAGNVILAQLYDKQNNVLATEANINDALSQIKRRERWQGVKTRIDTQIYHRDNLQRIDNINYQTASAGQSALGSIHYAYDPSQPTNNIATETESSGNGDTDLVISKTYQYSSNSNQLASSSVTKTTGGTEISANPVKTTYTRDNVGNVTHIHVDNPPTGTPADRDFNYYDNDTDSGSGNTLDRYHGEAGQNGAITYDSQGNLLTDGEGNKYTWYQGSNEEQSYTNAAKDVTNYSYSTHGRKKIQTNQAGEVQAALDTYYINGKLINTIESQGKDKNGNDLSGYQSAYLGNDVRVVLNANGNVQQMQFLQSDKTGTVRSSLTVDAKGNLLPSTRYHYNDDGSLVDDGQAVDTHLTIFYQPLTFNGDYHDQETGLLGTDYKLARSIKHYKAGVTRFISDDYGQQLMNRQLLDNGNTLSYRDAGGHWALSQTIGIVIAGVAFASLVGLGIYGLIIRQIEEEEIADLSAGNVYTPTNEIPWATHNSLMRAADELDEETVTHSFAPGDKRPLGPNTSIPATAPPGTQPIQRVEFDRHSPFLVDKARRLATAMNEAELPLLMRDGLATMRSEDPIIQGEIGGKCQLARFQRNVKFQEFATQAMAEYKTQQSCADKALSVVRRILGRTM